MPPIATVSAEKEALMSRKGLPHAAPSFPSEEVTGTRPVPAEGNEQGLASACTFARRLLDAGRAAGAMEILETHMAAGKDSAEFHFLLGRAAFRLGQHTQAHRAFSRAVSLSPQDAEVYRWLTRMLTRRDHALGTMRDLEWTSRLTPAQGAENEATKDPAESPFDNESPTLEDDVEPPTLQLEVRPATERKSQRRKR